MKKFLCLVFLSAVFISCSGKDGSASVSGVFEGEGRGLLGIVRVKVQIENNKVKNIDVLQYSDTPGYSDTVFEYLPARVIEADSTAVDVISGATITSRAFLDAVNDALKKANVHKAN